MELASITLHESLANQSLLKADAHQPGFAASAFPTFQNQSCTITVSDKITAQGVPSACAPQEERHG